MIFWRFLILFTFATLASCSNFTNESKVEDDLNVVELDSKTREKDSAKINNNSLNQSNIGPISSDIENGRLKTSSNVKVWGLNLSPGLSRVICQAVAARALFEKGIKFSVYSGAGMGAIVAAYLAEGTTPEIIEWKFHKFFQKTKDFRVFSDKWLERVEKDLLIEFKGKKIQNTRFTLLIPVYNSEERRIEFIRRGNLYDKLLINVTLNKNSTTKYINPIFAGEIKTNDFRKLGVQKLVSINTLGKKISFSKNEDFLFGIYGKLASAYVMNSGIKDEYNLVLKLDNLNLDSSENLPEYLRSTYLYVRDHSETIKAEYFREEKN